MTKTDPYKVIKSEVLKVINETPNIKTFIIKPDGGLSFSTGQFIQFTVPKVGEAPFTPSSSQFQREQIEITIMKTGRVTEEIHNLKENDFKIEVMQNLPSLQPFVLQKILRFKNMKAQNL